MNNPPRHPSIRIGVVTGSRPYGTNNKMVRRRYVRQFGNTPGHVNHWTRWGFRRFVATRFDVEQVASPLPWTMVRARPRH
jgi:hypothetical protein